MKRGIEKLKSMGFAPESILDIGGYHGDWTRMIKSIYPNARVHCFEAQPALENHMRAVAKTFTPSVTYTMALLGEEEKPEVDFHVLSTVHGSTGSSIYRENIDLPMTTIKLPVRTVDNVLAEQNVPSPQMIKIDVQGAEIDVLKGATIALATCDVILAELSLVDYNAGAPLIHEVMAFLAERDFVLFDIVDTSIRNGVTIQVDGVFVRKDSSFRQVWR